MRARIAVVGQLFGQFSYIGDPPSMIDLIGPFLVYVGDSATYRLTITDDADVRVDLTGAAIEVEVKRQLGAADPPTIGKTVGNGITLLDQDDLATRGQADVQISSADNSQPAGLYWIDVVVVIAGARVHAVAPREYTIAAVVNAA